MDESEETPPLPPADEAAALESTGGAAADAGPGLAGDLALCLSGGGYRATGFHLGVLDLLERVGLLARVRTLSTISGGTILGAAWALSRARREGFDAFYARAWETLRSLNVVREAVARLAERDRDASGGGGERPASLIRAAARVYAESPLLGTAKLGELIDAADPEQGPDELIFSATEFHSGRAYRFQTSRRSRVWVGNVPPLEIPAGVAREVRVADVVAASSCFPGAFEPLVFPRDFAWSDPAAVAAALGGFPPLPLMDGGIFDNQGVDGALTVYRRAGMFDQLGLLLVSDTSQRREPLLAEPRALGRPRVRVKTLALLARAGFWLAVLTFFAVLWPLLDATWTLRAAPRLLLTNLVPAALAAGAAGALWLGRRWLRRQLEAARIETGAELLPLLARLRAGDLLELANRRLRSLLAMASEVSMKRVRGLIQRALLGEDSRFQARAQVVLLYDLDERRERPRFDDLVPSLDLQLLARRAEAVPTTLWLDEEQLRDLVACGQATACLKLREHLRQRRAAALADAQSVEAAVEAKLKPLWEELRENPHALLRRARRATSQGQAAAARG
jgi:predicted acylesterase/phospholipase RssA